MHIKPIITLIFLFTSSLIFTQEESTKVLKDDPEQIEALKEYSYFVIEKVPVYSGCDVSLSSTEQKKCMSEKIAEHIGEHFDTEMISSLENIPEGFVKMRATFKIDTLGKITDIKVKAPHVKLKDEAIRVISLLPDLLSPGIMNGNPVIVTYNLPIVIENYPSKKSRKKRKKKN